MPERGLSRRGGRGALPLDGAGAERPVRRPGPDRPRDDRPGPGRRRRLATPIEQARAALRASPGYAVAAFVHLLAIVLLSIVGVVAAVQERERPPVEVRLVTQARVDVVTAEPGALLDDVAPPLPAEVDVAAPSHEALGATLGDLAADAVLGLAGAAGAGRGGQADARGGASAGSDAGVRGGLDWLLRHRAADGAWNVLPDDHARGALPRRGDSAITALALLCFLSAGPAEAVDARHGDVIAHATAWLVERVDRHGIVQGDLPDRTPPLQLDPATREPVDPPYSTWYWLPAGGYEGYHQATVTLALAQALSRRDDPAVRAALRRAAGCLEAAQDRKRGGWAYQPGLAGYTSLSGWAVMALRAAEQAGVAVQPGTWQAARGFLDLVSRPDGQTRYRPAQVGYGGHGMNASGLFMRLVLGEPPGTPRNAAAAALVGEVAAGRREWDACETYYAAMAMHQVGGAPWLRFNAPVRDGIVARQRQDGCERGSWRDEGLWLGGDPMASTLFATLTLETYYRYAPVHHDGEAARPREATLTGALESLGRVEALPAQERPAALGRVEVALRAAADRPTERLAALGGLVVAAALAGEVDQALARADEYMAALPAGAAPDAAVVRARRGALLQRALALLEGAAGAPAEGQARAAAALRAIEATLRQDVARLASDDPERRAAAAAAAELGRLCLRLSLAAAPDVTLARELAALPPPAAGPATPAEVELLLALLGRAQGALGDGRADPAALADAEADLEHVARRAPARRIDDPAARARVAAALERARLLRLGALQALGRDRELLEGVAALRGAPGEAPARAAALDALELGSLLRTYAAGQATAAQRERLLELGRAGLDLGGRLRPAAWLLLGRLLREEGAAAAAAERCGEAALAADPTPEEALEARLLRAGARLDRGDAAAAAADVEAAERAGAGARADVRLVRAALLRARGRPAEALREYQAVAAALDGDGSPAWWTAIEGVVRAQAEAGELGEARRVLSALMRRDRTFGGDEARARRLLDLMVQLDAAR